MKMVVFSVFVFIFKTNYTSAIIHQPSYIIPLKPLKLLEQKILFYILIDFESILLDFYAKRIHKQKPKKPPALMVPVFDLCC